MQSSPTYCTETHTSKQSLICWSGYAVLCVFHSGSKMSTDLAQPLTEAVKSYPMLYDMSQADSTAIVRDNVG